MHTPVIPRNGFVYRLHDRAWRWSEEMYGLFGFEPGEVVPSSDLIARHLTTEDNERFRALFENAVGGAVPMSRLHRIRAADRDRIVVTTLVSVIDDATGSPCVHGITTDVTADLEAEATRHAQVQIAGAVESHRTVDQAKGIIMLVYSLSPKRAFRLLNWLSQRHNTKLRTVADRIVEGARGADLLSTNRGLDLDRLLSDAVIADSAQPDRTRHTDRRYSTDIELTHDCTRVTVQGVVDLSTTPGLAETLATAGRLRPRNRLVVDLSAVTHLTPAGLTELNRFRHRVHALRRQRVTVISPASDGSPDAPNAPHKGRLLQ